MPWFSVILLCLCKEEEKLLPIYQGEIRLFGDINKSCGSPVGPLAVNPARVSNGQVLSEYQEDKQRDQVEFVQ